MEILSTRLRKSGGGWRGVVRYADGCGNAHETTRTWRGARKADAETMLTEWAAELRAKPAPQGRMAREPRREAVDTGPSLAEYVAEYVDALAASGQIEGSTATGYHNSVKRIARDLADAWVDTLTAARVRSWEAQMRAAGLSPHTIDKVHRLLRQAMRQAVAEGLADSNPVAEVRGPKRQNMREGINHLEAEGRARLFEALSGLRMTPVMAAAYVAVYTGLRRQEVCGLRWADVDAEARTIWVRRSVGIDHGKMYVKETKTGKQRDVAMSTGLAEALGRWREARPGGRLDYVLTGTREPMHPDTVTKHWCYFAEAHGLVGSEGRPCTFHDLRHTWATVAVSAGVDIKTVSGNLGHSNAAMTLNIYASPDRDAKRRAADVMDRAL